MAINAKLTSDFKKAALDIFDSMVSSAVLCTVFQPTKVDPVTGGYKPGACVSVRCVIPSVPLNRVANDNYETGTATAYIVFDEVPFRIVPGCEIRQPLDSTVEVVDPNAECPPYSGDIDAEDSDPVTTDTIDAGGAIVSNPVTSDRDFAIYTVIDAKVDAAEAVYTLTIRLK